MLLPLASPSRSLSLPRPRFLPPLRSTLRNAPATNRALAPPRPVRPTPNLPRSSPLVWVTSSGDRGCDCRCAGGVECRADLSQDAPYAVAIGACILGSLAFPVPRASDDSEDAGGGNLTDSRFGVMGVISIIPYFNWLCWVFAWLDGGEWRYLVYSAVYLAPYLRTNLSLSTDESWLPIASIFLCIIHVQLETSIRNGDIEGFSFSLFKDKIKKGQHQVRETHKEVKKEDPNVLPSAKDDLREKLKDREIPREPFDKQEQINGGENADEERGNW